MSFYFQVSSGLVTRWWLFRRTGICLPSTSPWVWLGCTNVDALLCKIGSEYVCWHSGQWLLSLIQFKASYKNQQDRMLCFFLWNIDHALSFEMSCVRVDFYIDVRAMILYIYILWIENSEFLNYLATFQAHDSINHTSVVFIWSNNF